MKDGRKRKGIEAEASAITTAPALPMDMAHLEEEKKSFLGLAPIQCPGTKIVIQNGKPCIEDALDIYKNNNANNKLIEVKKSDRLTSMSFRTRQHTEKWTPDENRKFYKALEIFGSDFSLISRIFKNRTRNQIKNKFHKEEKQGPQKVDAALKRHRKFNFRSLTEKINALNTAMIDEYAKKKEIIGEQPAKPTENQLEKFEKVDNISRNNSASSSVDSMDLSIMNEIREIFNVEIDLIRNRKNPQNALMFQNLANLPDLNKPLNSNINHNPL